MPVRQLHDLPGSCAMGTRFSGKIRRPGLLCASHTTSQLVVEPVVGSFWPQYGNGRGYAGPRAGAAGSVNAVRPGRSYPGHNARIQLPDGGRLARRFSTLPTSALRGEILRIGAAQGSLRWTQPLVPFSCATPLAKSGRATSRKTWSESVRCALKAQRRVLTRVLNSITVAVDRRKSWLIFDMQWAQRECAI